MHGADAEDPPTSLTAMVPIKEPNLDRSLKNLPKKQKLPGADVKTPATSRFVTEHTKIYSTKYTNKLGYSECLTSILNNLFF